MTHEELLTTVPTVWQSIWQFTKSKPMLWISLQVLFLLAVGYLLYKKEVLKFNFKKYGAIILSIYLIIFGLQVSIVHKDRLHDWKSTELTQYTDTLEQFIVKLDSLDYIKTFNAPKESFLTLSLPSPKDSAFVKWIGNGVLQSKIVVMKVNPDITEPYLTYVVLDNRIPLISFLHEYKENQVIGTLYVPEGYNSEKETIVDKETDS